MRLVICSEVNVSPTHVGMDRPLRGPQDGPSSEPHARGDGPLGDAENAYNSL